MDDGKKLGKERPLSPFQKRIQTEEVKGGNEFFEMRTDGVFVNRCPPKISFTGAQSFGA